MIEFDRADDPTAVDDVDEPQRDDDLDLDDGEHLAGLRRIGLPIRASQPRAPSVPSPLLEHLVAESWAPSARTRYESAWAGFAAWCATIRHIHDPLDATEVDVAEHVAYLVAAGAAASTIDVHLSAIANGFHLAERVSPTKHPLVVRVRAGARRHLGSAPRRRAAPLRLDELRRIIASMAILANRPPTDPVIRRDRALLTVGWAAALRASELVSLDVDDITIAGDPDRGTGGALITIRRSKTDQEARGRTVAVPYAAHIGSCPVRSVQLLIKERRTGPLFRHIDRHGRTRGRLSADAVSTIVQRHVTTVLGHDPGLFSGHSLRAGFVTEARARSVPEHLIMRQTGHKNARMLGTYDRPGDLLAKPVLQGDWW